MAAVDDEDVGFERVEAANANGPRVSDAGFHRTSERDEKENARRMLKGDRRFRKRNTAHRAIPRPGTKISKPVFGCELFVAHINLRIFWRGDK